MLPARPDINLPRSPGIYRITVARGRCAARFYIGQSVNVRARVGNHCAKLRNGNNKNLMLQRAYDKYGPSAFSFEFLESCSSDTAELAAAEKRQFDAQAALTGDDSLYNVCRDAMVSVLGVKRSAATRARQSEIAKSRPPMPDDIRRKISETKRVLGQRPPAEHMVRLRQLATGRKMNPKNLEALVAAKRGKKKSPEELARRTETRRANAILQGKEY